MTALGRAKPKVNMVCVSHYNHIHTPPKHTEISHCTVTGDCSGCCPNSGYSYIKMQVMIHPVFPHYTLIKTLSAFHYFRKLRMSHPNHCPLFFLIYVVLSPVLSLSLLLNSPTHTLHLTYNHIRKSPKNKTILLAGKKLCSFIQYNTNHCSWNFTLSEIWQ